MANVITEPSALLKVIGKGKPNIAYCSNCGVSQLNVQWCRDQQYSWAINLSCLLCSTKWTICTLCSSLRVPLLRYAIGRHHRTKHPGNPQPPVNDVIETPGCGVSIQRTSPCSVGMDEVIVDCSTVLHLGGELSYIDFGNAGSNFFSIMKKQERNQAEVLRLL
jgi:hypothetical protein